MYFENPDAIYYVTFLYHFAVHYSRSVTLDIEDTAKRNFSFYCHNGLCSGCGPHPFQRRTKLVDYAGDKHNKNAQYNNIAKAEPFFGYNRFRFLRGLPLDTFVGIWLIIKINHFPNFTHRLSL